MSKRKDRERAESGLIFRNGKLMSKEEWAILNPTSEEVATRQNGVDTAVADHLAKINQ